MPCRAKANRLLGGEINGPGASARKRPHEPESRDCDFDVLGGRGREAPDSRLIRTDPSHPEQKPVQNSKNVDLTQDTAPNEKSARGPGRSWGPDSHTQSDGCS